MSRRRPVSFIKYLFRWPLWHMPIAIVLLCSVIGALIPQKILGGAEAWSLDKLSANTRYAESKDVYIVKIIDEDYRSPSLFNSHSPLSATTVNLLLAKLIDLSTPKVIGVDLDTKDDDWTTAVDNSTCEIMGDGTPFNLREDSDVCKAQQDSSAPTKCGVSCLMPKSGRISVVWARIPVERKSGSSIQVYQLLGGRPELADTNKFSGIPRFSLDSDGLVRRYEHDFTLDGGSSAPSFAKAIANKYNGSGQSGKERIFNFGRANMFRSLSATRLIHFARGADPDADDWIDGARGKIVLIGGDFEDARDTYPTPLGSLPGVELNALAIDSYLNNPGTRDLPELVLFVIDLCVGMAFVFVFWLFEYPLHKLFLARPYLPLLLGTFLLLVLGVLTSYTLLHLGRSTVWFNFIPMLVGVNIHQFYEHFESLKKEAALEEEPRRHRHRQPRHSE